MKVKITARHIVYILIVMIIIMSITLLVMKHGLDEIAKQKSVSEYMVANTDWKRKDKVEAVYTARMYDIIDLFSSKKQSKSMSKAMRIKYTYINYKLAGKFGWSPYVIPILHLLESDFNPHKDHEPYKEVGMGGAWYSTAKVYWQKAKNEMPRELWNQVKFDLKNRNSLKDPINALKMTYMWIWIELKNYNGNWLWAISAYRWGRFVGQHWRNKLKDFPTKFVIYTSYFGKKVYNPRAYHWTWKHLKSSFERGDMAVAKDIYDDWKKYKDTLKTEEIEYRQNTKIIKQQQKVINEYLEIEKTSKAMKIHLLEKIKKQNERKLKSMKRVGREAKKEGWTKRNIKKFRDLCKGIWEKF